MRCMPSGPARAHGFLRRISTRFGRVDFTTKRADACIRPRVRRSRHRVAGIRRESSDPDIAVYLAFLHLRMNPVQAETARRLALYAIFVSGTQRSIRFGDWDTLAVASALVGRESDAIRALYVEIALTSNLDRTCQNALSAYATFGERVRVPVQAMFNRVDSNGRVSPYCEWPPKWNTAMRW